MRIEVQMKKIKEKINYLPEFPIIFDLFFKNKKFAVLDIETTGLSPNFSSIILVGLIVFDGKNTYLHQLFAETPQEEKEIIIETDNLIREVDYIITYNGRMFDIPFLNKRSEKYNLKFTQIFNFDLFIIMKYYSDLPKLIKSMSQKSLEVFAGLSDAREDKISGGESVELYSQYQATHSPNILSQILLHNSDDIRQLFQLVKLVKHSDFAKAICHQGMPHVGGYIGKIDYKKSTLFIKGYAFPAIDYISFPSPESPYSLSMTKLTSEYIIEIPCESIVGSAYFDLTNLVEEKHLSSFNLPGFNNDYLIIKENNKFNYTEIALFAQIFASKLINEVIHNL